MLNFSAQSAKKWWPLEFSLNPCRELILLASLELLVGSETTGARGAWSTAPGWL